jgi:Cu/Ag efflux pump CusA
MKIDGVQSVSQWVGRAERGADTYGSHYSEYEVHLNSLSGTQQQEVLNQLRAILKDSVGILYEANTFLTERVDETISGYTSPVVVNIYGNDLNALDEKAQSVATIMRNLQECEHRFITDTHTMDVIAYHPDSDWGPTHDEHPMVNRTWVNGHKIDNHAPQHQAAAIIRGR